MSLANRAVAAGIEPQGICDLLVVHRLHYEPQNAKATRRDYLQRTIFAAGQAVQEIEQAYADPNPFEGVTPVDLFSDMRGRLPDWKREHYPPVIANLAVDIAERVGCAPSIPAWAAVVAAAGLTPRMASTCCQALPSSI